jgi:hypothetical protein
MSEKTSYRVGRWIAQNPGPTVGLAAVIAIALYAVTAEPTPYSPPPAQVAAVVAEPIDPRIEACGPKLDERRAQAKAAAAKKQFSEAYRLMSYCAPRLEKESAGYKEFMTYADAHAKAFEAEKAAVAKAEKARKKKEGVHIGMSEQDVLDSAWGRPNHINRTTNAYGTREQWVYGGRNYLYFKNGELVSIQN